ncbi:MAG: VIT1/CCC1 transporter family protein [Saprospiraceae bacterium]|nr:VIT1/CCC1 transporter family protein [Saprospiraceae bacterium]
MKNKNIQTEVDTGYLYEILANHENDEQIAIIFKQMSEIEKGHAIAFLKKSNLPVTPYPSPSFRAKFIGYLGKVFGYDFILGMLLDTEKNLSNVIRTKKEQLKVENSISDTSHVTILKNILNQQTSVSGSSLARFEKRHRSVGGNALRAAVLGGNDGLVSNFSLIMGIAGATSGNQEILLAGTAGLLAGALSMALGEWISVKSSQELYENQMNLEMEEIEINPEGEEKEVVLIYMAKGIPENDAKAMAKEIMVHKSKAHELLVKEELGINSADLKGSAMEAAVTSFILFAIGAIIPVIPYFFLTGMKALFLSVGMSAIGLFLIGSAITLFTGKSIFYSGSRQVIFGLAAAAITYGIGSLIGVQLAG